MPRPFKPRCVAHRPGVTVFKPAGIPASKLERVEIHLDELEAFCLVDGKGLEQAEAAESMKVSRATVGRIIRGVRHKVARALVHGHAIFIKQGNAPVEHRSPPVAGKKRVRNQPNRKRGGSATRESHRTA